MPNITFLDEEDRGLAQLARRYAALGTERIPWKKVAHELKRWKRSPVELAQRMNSLKRTYGTDLTKFPSSFFSPIRAARDKVVSQIVSTLFKDIARREVVYPASEPHLNAGELLPDGVISQIKAIQRINPIQSRDVFLDIGSGVGNVVAQFALSTKVRACIGIEIRRVYAEDVNQIDLSLTYPFSSATIVLANNLRFEPSTTLHITNELLFLTDAWLVVFTSEVCPRHSSTCSNVFCTRWKLETVATLKVSWTATLVPAYLYTERK
eukprot:jgi/Phyca11/96254/e_gw1.1.1318.1